MPSAVTSAIPPWTCANAWPSTEARLPLALSELVARYGCEAVILSTCNRVELYLGRLAAPAPMGADLIAEFLAEFHGLNAAELRPHLYEHLGIDAVRHLFRVAASLDSLIVGEGQIAGQVKQAYELATKHGSVGPLLHALFQHARIVAKRVRSETGIAQGQVSVSSAAVDYVRQVFDHFRRQDDPGDRRRQDGRADAEAPAASEAAGASW